MNFSKNFGLLFFVSFFSINCSAQSYKKIEGVTPLMKAAIYADYAELKKMVKSGVDINSKDSQGHTALHYAARSMQSDKLVIKSVKYLIKHGAKFDLDCYLLDDMYKYEDFACIREIIFNNLNFFEKIAYKLWRALDHKK
jgi:ankyrin repeat protein